MFLVYGFGFDDPMIFVWIIMTVIAIYKGFHDYRRYSPWYGMLIGVVIALIIMLFNVSWLIQSIVMLSISIIGIYICNKYN